MKIIPVAMSVLLLAPLTIPARADFKYTETSTITGGSLKNAMKFVGVFSKQASQAMKPITTTHYIKGNRLRTDSTEGTTQIIDLDGRRVITIDSQKRTYSEVTFDEMKKSMEAAQAKAQEAPEQKPASDPKASDVKANIDVKFEVLPGSGTREILGQTANETKVRVNMDMQARDTSKAGPEGQPVSGSIITTLDMWVAPSVPGYQEFAQFYVRMAREVNWVPPANVHIDPRASQSLDEVQKNSANLKGFPLLQYMTMSLAGQPMDAAGQTASSAPPSQSSSSDSMPTSMSGAMAKGLGGLFNKKKKQDDAAEQASANAQPSTPGSLMEMTIETTTYSDSSLDASLFDVPSGFARISGTPDQVMTPRTGREK